MKILIGFKVIVSWMTNSVVICRSSLDDERSVLCLLASFISITLIGLFPRNRFSVSGRIAFDLSQYWISKLNSERNWAQWTWQGLRCLVVMKYCKLW